MIRKNEKPRKHCIFGAIKKAGDGAHGIRWMPVYAPTEPAGETEPTGFKVSLARKKRPPINSEVFFASR